MAKKLFLDVEAPKPKADDSGSRPLFWWPLEALVAGVAAALAVWLVCAGAMLTAWFSDSAMTFQEIVRLAQEIILLGCGVPLEGYGLAIAPLGVALLTAGSVAAAARAAGRQASLARPGASWPRAAAAGLVLAGFLAVGTLLAVTALPSDGWEATLPLAGRGLGLIGVLGVCWGNAGWIGGLAKPPWTGWIWRGWRAGSAVLLLAACAALAAATWAGQDSLARLDGALALDTAGVATWALVCLAWLPNLLAWAAAWALGVPVDLGAASQTWIGGTDVGMLPGLPFFALVPAEVAAEPWLALWMLTGALAGAAAGLAVASSRPEPGHVAAAVCGLASGLLVAAGLAALAAAGSGDLGTLRLTGLGPRLGPLLIVPPALIGLSGALSAAAWSLWRGEAVPVEELTTAAVVADVWPGQAVDGGRTGAVPAQAARPSEPESASTTGSAESGDANPAAEGAAEHTPPGEPDMAPVAGRTERPDVDPTGGVADQGGL
ncbi:MAG: DUF6350 family protein [Propionibacteriaceae bacterium]|jgi:hypothetical protein|nr:DUF6350 family protein [Propionibacteriaceae bacterium]